MATDAHRWLDSRIGVSDEFELPVNKHTTTVNYKTRNGEVKTLNIVQPLDPSQRTLSLADIQILAKKISEELRKDAF